MLQKYIVLMKEFFEKENMRFALIGGLALNTYGYTRFTNDVDFLTESKNSEVLQSYLDSLGFKVLQSDSAFSLHTLFNERIDLMYVNGDTADKILGSTQIKKIGNIELPVISPIYLALMKGFAASQDPDRIRDLDDVKKLYYLNHISKSDIELICEKYGHKEYFKQLLNETISGDKNEKRR